MQMCLDRVIDPELHSCHADVSGDPADRAERAGPGRRDRSSSRILGPELLTLRDSSGERNTQVRLTSDCLFQQKADQRLIRLKPVAPLGMPFAWTIFSRPYVVSKEPRTWFR